MPDYELINIMADRDRRECEAEIKAAEYDAWAEQIAALRLTPDMPPEAIHDMIANALGEE